MDGVGGSGVTAAGRGAWLALSELFTTGEARDRMVEVAAGLGLTPALLRALGELPEAAPVRMSQLAESWRCDPSYVTGVVKNLEQRGFAQRRTHPADGRVREVTVTDAGRSVREAASALLAEPPSTMANLSAAEQRQLLHLLDKLGAVRPDQAVATTGGPT